MPHSIVLSLQDVTARYGAAVAGTPAPAAGAVRVLGRRECDDPLAYRRLIGAAPQELAFYDELTAGENLRFFGRLYGLGGRDLRRRVAETLDFVRLTEQARRPARTS